VDGISGKATSGIPVYPDPINFQNMDIINQEVRSSFLPIKQRIPYERIGGADCYQIEPEDRHLVRSFMLGIHRVYSSGQKRIPKVTISRVGPELRIICIPQEKNRPSYIIQVTGLIGILSLQGIKSENIQRFQDHLKKYLHNWDKGTRKSESSIKDCFINTAGVFSSFRACSPVELMEFLTYASHQMSYC